jgi:hypothetical protein
MMVLLQLNVKNTTTLKYPNIVRTPTVIPHISLHLSQLILIEYQNNKKKKLAALFRTRRVICKFKQLQSRPNATLFSEVLFVFYLKSIFKKF